MDFLSDFVHSFLVMLNRSNSDAIPDLLEIMEENGSATALYPEIFLKVWEGKTLRQERTRPRTIARLAKRDSGAFMLRGGPES